MKVIRKALLVKSLMILISTCCCTLHLLATSCEYYSPDRNAAFYNERTFAPQVSNMLRYGSVQTALFTGKLNFSIPIYTLDDPDFDLHVALSYNSEGFQPRKHSGFIGYNWFLEAGGCITREVRDIPDEAIQYDQQSSTTMIGMLRYIEDNAVDKNRVFYFDKELFTDCTVENSSIVDYRLGDQCDFWMDYLPDIFNFNFCGYQGKFMINNMGKPIILEGDFIDVDLSGIYETYSLNPTEYPQPNSQSQITIKTNDGYTYIFGGDLSAIEYTISAKDTHQPMLQSNPTISTWHLKQIIAPNNRHITYHYKSGVENLLLFNEYYDWFIGTSTNLDDINVSKMKYNMVKECVLESISVSGNQHLTVKFISALDFNKKYNHSHYSLCNYNYMLNSIEVVSNERVLKRANLSYMHMSSGANGGYFNWRFLSSVKITGVGEYTLKYDHSTPYPNLYTPEEAYREEANFYGYWLGNPCGGLLTEVGFPTGGIQKYQYEKHQYGKEFRYEVKNGSDIEIIEVVPNEIITLGARIKRVETYSEGELIEIKTYSYNRINSNTSSGVYYNQIKIYDDIAPTNTLPYGKPMLIKNNNSYSCLTSKIAYARVEETTTRTRTNETNKTEYTFEVGCSGYDSSTDSTINRFIPSSEDNIYAIISATLTYDNKYAPVGKLSSIKYYNGNSLVHSKVYKYNNQPLTSELHSPSDSSFGCLDTVVILSPYLVTIARKLLIYPPLLEQEITNDYGVDGRPLSNIKQYVYDEKYRVQKLICKNSDDIEYFTEYTYVDDVYTPPTTPPTPNPYFLLYQRHIFNKPIEVINGYVENNQKRIISGVVNLYSIGTTANVPQQPNMYVFPGAGNTLDRDTINNSDSYGEIIYYPYLSKTLSLQVQNGINDYQMVSLNGAELNYDSRYKAVNEYTFDSQLRPTSIMSIDQVITRYTWDGILPTSKTIGDNTYFYTHIPFVGVNRIVDPRGLVTGYNYYDNGKLKEKYIINNENTEILNAYYYNIRTDNDSCSLHNYIVSIQPKEVTSDITFNASTMSVDGNVFTNKTLNYYDGLGRSYESIALGQSPTGNDLVTMTSYTGLDLVTHQWLPLSVQTGNYPIIPANYVSQAETFYSDTRPFQETKFETSALNRVIASVRPGADYASHPATQTYGSNSDDVVRILSVVYEKLSGGEVVMKLKCDNRNYNNQTLYKLTTSDEDQKTITTFTDKLGRKILERQDGNDTYYVYDRKGQLCYVLPPLAVSQITPGIHSDTIDVLKKYAYVYKYDERGNQIYKRLPGCEPILMVYDKSNALVLSQTGNQRARGTYWTVYKYDSLRRLIYTAEVKVGSNDHEGQIKDFSQWLVTERFSTDEQLYPMSNTGYSRSFYDSQPIKLLTVNYYDDYQFLSFIADTMQSRMAFEAFSDNSGIANATGLLTGTRTYYLDKTGNYSETVYYYDYRGREIQRRTTNHLGGIDVLSTKYDFVNNITDTWSSQSTNNGLTTTEHYHYEYDHANRLLTTTYTFNNEPPIELQSYHYDELGRVRSRHIHSGSDSVAFNYDIRNQVTQIKSSGYEQKYYYNQSCPIAPDFSGGLYNGNISATTWTYGNQTNGYVYHYDKMNRLESNYSILNGSLNVDCLYSESFSYDAQGNVTNLTRWDNNDLMNYLQLTYDGNQLVNVDDNGFGSYEYATKQYHDNNTEGDDFAYDANGNMIYDQDRGIAAIRYNLLNLPDTIQFTNGNLIIHRYDAAGNRLETKYLTKKSTTTVPLGNVLSTPKRPEIFYITRDAFHNNIVYTANNTDAYGIEFVHNPEGYIRYLTAEEHYHFYYIKDLLGNIRETYVHPETGYKECIQRTQYYPSGLPWAEAMVPAEQPYKYNSKEFVEMHGLDEYDSKARWYYPAICRTTTMDPLAEKYYSTSPYAWCKGNPVNNIDPFGMDVWEIDSIGRIISRTENTDKDEIFTVTSSGDTTSVSFTYGTIEQQEERKEGDKVKYTWFDVRGDKNGTKLFEFFANNTTVEWSQFMMGIEGDKGLNVISTSHELGEENAAPFLMENKLMNGYTIRQYIHNHPGGSTKPSGEVDWTHPKTGKKYHAGTYGDVGFAKWIYDHTHNKHTKYLIYTRINRYKPY